jgi:hypothetical protein
MTDPIGVITPDELRAAQRRILDSELRAWCKLIADNLAASIEMARERGEQPDAAETKLELVCDYEATFAKRVHGREMPRYEPRWPSRREDAA